MTDVLDELDYLDMFYVYVTDENNVERLYAETTSFNVATAIAESYMVTYPERKVRIE